MNPKEGHHIGVLGEDIAQTFLKKRGFIIIERNYRKKYGEIDIVAERRGELCFVEVKSISQRFGSSVIQQPEENVNAQKLKKMARVVQSYLLSKKREKERWRFLVVAVFIDEGTKTAHVRCTEDVIPE